MAGKLSFSIAINLLTENFKRGTNQVKNAFRSMQAQVLTFAAALGAGGIGLSNLVSRFVEVARETSRVTTSLKNVSGSMSRYADNQRYLLDIAKKYGLEINALTGNFAKFTAAASISGMSMENQRKIFESVSRACTAFGMNADDSNGVMLALSQMMSKGKISSEELRLQMGERLPIALQAMAKAAGVSVAGLDKLLKQGKLMSADVLPKFAEALNEMIPNVDTDNLETSVNRLKNKFTELVNSMDVQSKYKSLVDWLSSALSGLQSKISGIVAFVITIVSGKLLTSIVAYFGKYWNLITTTVNKAKVAEEQKLLFASQRIEAERVYEATLTAYNTQENGKRLASKSALRKAEKTFNTASLAEKRAIDNAKVASEKAAAVQTTGIWGKTANTIKLAWASVAMTVKTLWSAVWPMALITAIGALVGKFFELRAEAKRVKNIFSEYKAEADKAGNTQEVVMLKTQLGIMNDKKQSLENINNAQAQLQKMLGVENKSQKELNNLVAKRVKILENAAKVDYYTRKKIEAQDQYSSLNDKHSKIKAKTMNGGFFTRLWYGSEVGDTKKEMNELLRIIKDSSIEISKATIETNQLSGSNNDDLGDEDPDKKSELQKAEEKYAQSLRELDAQREIEKMSDSEYYKAVDELARKMLIEAKSSENKELKNSEYIKMLEDVMTNPLYNGVHDELAKVEAEYKKNVELAKAKLDKKLITEDEYRQALIDASIAAANSAISIDGIGDAADGFIKKMQGVVGDNLKIEKPKLKQRDTTFDYKKTDTDKLSETVDIWIEYRDNLKDKLAEAKKSGSNLAVSLQSDLDNAMANVTDFEKALKIAQVKKDIKDLNQEIGGMEWGMTKGVMSDIDGIVSAFERLKEAFDPDSEADGWERLMALWNMFSGVIDSVMSVCKTIEALTELTDKLAKAKEVEAAIDTNATQQKVTNAATGAAATIAAAAAEKTAATGEVAANTAKGASAAGASAAKLPFPWNIVAIGGAIAAAMAAFAVIPKFAGGGIIAGGPTSGDKILARVNAGEMILNGSQQSNLFDAINSGNIGGGKALSSSVSTKVRAKDLILTINNELKSQGKKPIS